MTFLNPALLFGLFAIGLPIAIHLLSKPRIRRIQWAAMRFLMDAIHKNRRRVQVEDLLLLILRIILVALLVLIFARPALLTDAPTQLGGLAAPAVILLDNSESMGQSNGTKTRFEQAKGMADDLLSKLASGSACALYLVSDHVKAVISRPTQDMAILRHSIDQAPLTDGGSDLYPGIKSAVDLLKSLPGTHREIFILTDGQASALKQLGNIHELQNANKDISMHFIVVGDKGEDNVAVTKIQLAGTVASVGQPLRCVVTVSNFGQVAVQNMVVKLGSDGAPPSDEGTISHIDPGSSKSVTLVARFRDPGYHSLTASIPGDRLASDNQRSIALLVIDQVHVLIVEGTPPARDPVERDGFFLSHALVPVGPDEVARYYVNVATGRPDDLENSSIGKYQMIFLSNVAEITPRGAQNLRDYVTKGGGLVVFPGPATDINFYNSDPNFSLLLPAKFGAPVDAPGQKPLGWQSQGYEHPLVTLWNQPDSGNLANVHVTRYFPLTLKDPAPAGATGTAQVVKYTDGETAVAEQSVGKGKVVTFSSTATTAWTSLPVHPAFVPLLSRIISYETNGLSGNLNISPGQAFGAPIDSEFVGRELSVIKPGEKKKKVVGEVESGDTSAFLRFGDTEMAGPYQLFVGDEPLPNVVFAVQGDPEESNLAQAPKTDLDSLLNADNAGTDSHGNPTDQPAKNRPRIPGQELWFPLAIAALIFAMAETALAHWFSQSR